MAAWGEPSPPRPCPRRGKRERGESKSKFLAAAGNYLLAHAESALSPQPPNSLEPLEGRHSQFLKRVKPASLGGTNGCTQSGPPMPTIQAKPTYITYSCSQPGYQLSSAAIPRTAITLIKLERTKGAWGRNLGTTIGVLTGIIVGGYVAGTAADSASVGIPVFLVMASAATLAGYYAGRGLDARVTLIRIVPE